MINRGELGRIEKLMCIKPRQLAIHALLACGAFCSLLALGQTSPHDGVWDPQMQAAYSHHFAKVQQMLPAHSALPPLLDLTKAKIDGSGKDRAWEKPYDLSVRKAGIIDPGVPSSSDATSTATTFFDTAGRPDPLPVRICEAVVVGEPIASEVRISRSRKLVYSQFSVRVLTVFKGKKKAGIREGAIVAAVQFGGSVRFPSGHLTTFLVAGSGFMALEKQYVLFLWKPHNSAQTFMAAEPYLIEDGHVFPIQTEADGSAYEGMPANQFEAKLKSAIAQNVDAN